jgi:hypothetical protein
MKYHVPVMIELELDLDDVDGEIEAVKAVDELLQRAWDTDQGRKYQPHAASWHFELEGGADRIDETVSVDEAVEEDLRLIRKLNDDDHV